MFNPLILGIMFKSMLSELRANFLVFVPADKINNFCVYCRLKGARIHGGAIEPDGQYFYIDRK